MYRRSREERGNMKDVIDALNWAIDEAEKLPERYREIAFSELFQYALAHIGKEIVGEKTDDVESFNSVSTSTKFETRDGIPEAHIISVKGKQKHHVAWAIWKINNNGEEANNKSIRDAIRDHLAVSPPNRQNTNRVLRDLTPRYVIRTKVGKEYQYKPSSKIFEAFKDLSDDK